jgi:DNA modification methylase
MKTYVQLNNTQRAKLPPEFRNDDVRFSESLAEYFIEHFTQPGEIVFDPFAGFGTTLLVAEAMERIPFGLEFDPRRVAYVQTRLQHPHRLLHGDARQLATYDVPPFDLSLTSPPYMQKDDPEDPFAAYTTPGRGYQAYLQDIQQVYAQMRQVMKPQAHIVIEVANLKGARGVTPLAWDVAAAVGQVLIFEGEIVITWEPTYGYGYDHSYCLIFRKP